MKDAFGGAFIIRIMLIFFVVFICFMTVAISYAKTFRIKNNVINILEKSSNDQKENTMNRIDDYVRSVGYSYSTNQKVIDNCSAQSNNDFSDTSSTTILSGNISGVCVVPIGNESSYYYKVSAYIVLDFPLFRLGVAVPISGESKTINKIFN